MSSDFASETRARVARKQHQCIECFRTIFEGERYVTTCGKWEGEFYINKACLPCARFRAMVYDIDTDFWEYCYGGLHAWVENDNWQELPAGVPWLVKLHMRRLSQLFSWHWEGLAGELDDAAACVIRETRDSRATQRHSPIPASWANETRRELLDA